MTADKKPIASPHDPAMPSVIKLDGETFEIKNWHIDCAGESVSTPLTLRALANFLLAEADKREGEEMEFKNTRMFHSDGWEMATD